MRNTSFKHLKRGPSIDITLKETHRFAYYWLVFMACAVVVFGITMLISPALIRRVFSLLVFCSPEAVDAMPEAAVDYITMTHSVLGAVLAGWGMTMLLLLLGHSGGRPAKPG